MLLKPKGSDSAVAVLTSTIGLSIYLSIDWYNLWLRSLFWTDGSIFHWYNQVHSKTNFQRSCNYIFTHRKIWADEQFSCIVFQLCGKGVFVILTFPVILFQGPNKVLPMFILCLESSTHFLYVVVYTTSIYSL